MSNAVLTARQARFIDEYLVDANGTQAAIRAGYGAAGARVTASRLLTNVAISRVIAVRQQQDATRLAIDRNRVLGGLLEAYELAKDQMNPAAMVQATREIARLLGLYAPQRVKVALNDGQAAEMRRMESMSDCELMALVAGAATS